MTRLHCVSGAAALALLVTAGCVGPGRNVLIVANEAEAAEVVPDWWRAPGAASLTDRFDAVLSWNEVIAPLHPGAWQPPAPEIPMLTRMLRDRLSPDAAPTELVVESLAAGPGRALAVLVPDVPITVVAATPAVYGPSAGDLGSDLGERITRLVHVDLVAGLRPLLVPDASTTTVVTRDDHRAALATLSPPAGAAAVLLDEGWAAAGTLTVDEEFDLHLDAVRHLVAAGHRTVTLAPDAAAGPADRTRLTAAAADLGVTLTVGPAGVAHEAWLAASPEVVVGTAAATLYLAPNARTVGTRLVLDRLRPYEHPARIPVTVADAVLTELGGAAARPADPQPLVDAVSYCMRSAQLPDLREAAQSFVDANDVQPYFRRKRLEALDLAPQARRGHPTARPPAAAKARSLLRRLKT